MQFVIFELNVNLFFQGLRLVTWNELMLHNVW